MINVVGITKIDVNIFLNDMHDFKATSRYRIFNNNSANNLITYNIQLLMKLMNIKIPLFRGCVLNIVRIKRWCFTFWPTVSNNERVLNARRLRIERCTLQCGHSSPAVSRCPPSCQSNIITEHCDDVRVSN